MQFSILCLIAERLLFLVEILGKHLNMTEYLGSYKNVPELSLFYSMSVEENVKLGLFAFLKTNLFKDF